VLVLINAVKAITRSKGRNIVIMLIVAVIAGASSVALAIRSAAASAESDGLDQLTITATIGLDRQQLIQSAQTGSSTAPPSMDNLRDLMAQYPELSLDQLQTYADSQYVADFRYSTSISVDATGDVAPVSNEDQTSDDTDPANQPPGGFVIQDSGQGPFRFGGRALGDLTLAGYGSESAMTAFTAGESQITGGAMIDLAQADNQVLVSDEFAAFNSLSVGDTVTVANPAAESETYQLTIAGIYHTTGSTSATLPPGAVIATAQDPANRLIASAPTVAALAEQSAAVATDTTDDQGQTVSTALVPQVGASYVFASPADFEAFSQQVRDQGLDQAYQVSSADLDSYEASLVPLHNLASFARTLLGIVLGVGAVVLVAVAIFSIRERQYEVGVLTAIGITKPTVALQFVVEMFIVTILGLVIGLGAGAAAAVPVADNLLSAQVAQQQAQSQAVDQNFGRVTFGGGPGGVDAGPALAGPFGRTVDYLSQINATLDLAVIAQLAAIGLGLALIASAAGVIFAMRYEPLTILANRA
jgi:putative ABC transport system permease protein